MSEINSYYIRISPEFTLVRYTQNLLNTYWNKMQGRKKMYVKWEVSSQEKQQQQPLKYQSPLHAKQISAISLK